ncbi:FG-GAP repeat domain-containing protein [Stigmatella erecta]|uniref:SH3 domain-containing protein n=1 Tax=Stigmatella erecta TaxID=83460 RepID=A0A1I0KCL2_9BACT|nr:VCBS repeat-containing protein [Stigmatella erecta]SEU21807.1 hypothetical protein SAMN05443639_11052 [Stigmatella erecta]
MNRPCWKPALAGLLLCPLLVQAAEPTSSTSADLDGDGKPESISLRWEEGEGTFTLKVAGKAVQGKAEDTEVHGVTVVDLDRGDKWKEVAVNMGLTDGDAHCVLYGFDGKSLKELGGVHALTETSGNGIILSDSWMGFWNRREKYVLDRKAWKLSHVPQELYAVGAEGTVKQSFALVRSRTDGAVVANVAPGSKISVLAAGAPGPQGAPRWYLVKSATGLLGWTQEQNLLDKTEGLPWAG